MAGFPRHLRDVDPNEVSLVRRPANRRRLLLKKGDDMAETLDPELLDMLSVPAPGEGAILDEIRKDGIDESEEQAIVAAMRLVNGVRENLSRESIEKLGTEMYARENPPLNTGEGNSSGGDLTGSGSAVALADDGNDAEPDCDPDDMQDKADFSDSDRKNLASRGQALPDGSYPIRNKSDLQNAIQAFGRAKDKGRAKAWIIRRAKALGATSSLPESWNVSKQDDREEGTVEVHGPVRKEDGTWDLSGLPDESRAFYEEMVAKAAEGEAVKERLEKAEQDAAAAIEQLQRKELVEKAETEFGKVGPPSDVADILKAASGWDEETRGKLEQILKGASEKIEAGELFAELGATSRGEDARSGSAYAEAVSKADEMVEKADGMSREVAMAKVWEENPGLYERYLAETGRAVS